MSASGRDCVITRDLSECPLSRKQTFRMYVLGSSRMSAYGRKQPSVNSLVSTAKCNGELKSSVVEDLVWCQGAKAFSRSIVQSVFYLSNLRAG